MSDIHSDTDNTAAGDGGNFQDIDATSEKRFFNRELSWLLFNTRVMEEAGNPNHPLLERLRFLSISATNLDEFYMVRVAGLKGQVRAGVQSISQDGLSPSQQLRAIHTAVEKLMQDQQSLFHSLIQEMRDEGVSLIKPDELSDDDMQWLETYFMDQVFPVLTPLAVDPAHPFPFIPNFGFALVLKLEAPGDADDLRALLPIPHLLNRFIRLPGDDIRFISLEDLIEMFLDKLFPDFKLLMKGRFRLIRDSVVEIDEEAEDLVRTFESALKRRRRGVTILLGMHSDTPDELRELVIENMELGADDVVYRDGLLGLAETSQLIVDDRPDLLFEPFNARFPERVRDFNGDCFTAIRKKDFIVHHPYESFEVVVRYLQQAATDPDVLAFMC